MKRRLRHLARERLGSLPEQTLLVLRAHPAAAGASYAELGAELDRCLERCVGKLAKRATATASTPEAVQ